MKTKRLLKLFKLLFTFYFSLSFIGCSNSESEPSNNACSTFLECQEGSVWNVSFETNSDYLTFLNNSNIVFKVYSITENDCYNVYNASDAYGSLPINLLENSENKLVFRIDDNNQYRLETLDYSNEVITYNIKVYIDNELVENETQSLTKNDVDLNSLTLCN